MDLTFLPLPNDLCRIISTMKYNIEWGPVLKEIREREKSIYEGRGYCHTERYNFSLCGNFKKLHNINRYVRDVDVALLTSGYGYCMRAEVFYITNHILYHLDCMRTVKEMKAHLRDNKVKGYSKLRKDELRTLCLSF